MNPLITASLKSTPASLSQDLPPLPSQLNVNLDPALASGTSLEFVLHSGCKLLSQTSPSPALAFTKLFSFPIVIVAPATEALPPAVPVQSPSVPSLLTPALLESAELVNPLSLAPSALAASSESYT